MFCTGCAVCVDICKSSAVKMVNDNEGFLYPSIDNNKCTRCGLCERVCPYNAEKKSLINSVSCYMAKNKSVTRQMESSSGGIFTEFADKILSNGGVVYGAAFDCKFNVAHIKIDSVEDISKLRKSKYVQSNTIGIYKSVREQLKIGKTVLFSGTPCQTTALYEFVGEKLRENLYIIDLICHGVPSPMVWEDFISCISEMYGKKTSEINDIQFKYKDDTYTWTHPGFMIEWTDSTKYLDYSNNSWYENGFLGNLYVRPSCHNCRYKSLSSKSDITIGDFWGCQGLYPDFYDPKGVSVICVKSEKGANLFSSVAGEFMYKNIPIEQIIENNRRLIESSIPNKKRSSFWNEYLKIRKKDISMCNMENLVKKYTRISLFTRYNRKVKNAIKRIIKTLVDCKSRE